MEMRRIRNILSDSNSLSVVHFFSGITAILLSVYAHQNAYAQLSMVTTVSFECSAVTNVDLNHPLQRIAYQEFKVRNIPTTDIKYVRFCKEGVTSRLVFYRFSDESDGKMSLPLAPYLITLDTSTNKVLNVQISSGIQ